MDLKKYTLTVCICLAAAVSIAQSAYRNSEEQMKKGLAFLAQNDNKRAEDAFMGIHPCDTNHPRAVYYLIKTLLADKRPAEALGWAHQEIARLYNSADALHQLFSVYLANKYYDSALTICDSIARMRPGDVSPLLEKASILTFDIHNHVAAEALGIHIVKTNPQIGMAHLLLAHAYAQQGKFAEALMAAQTCLLFTTDSIEVVAGMDIIYDVCQQREGLDQVYIAHQEELRNSSFAAAGGIIASKMALDAKYKVKIDVDNVLFRQYIAMMEHVEFIPADSSFAMQFYVPLLKDLFKEDNGMGALLAATVGKGFGMIDLAAGRHADEILNAQKVTKEYIADMAEKGVVNYQQRKTAPVVNKLTANNMMQRNGADGVLRIYRKDGSLYGAGKCDDKGNKDGLWQFYYSSGNRMRTERYRNSVLVDTMVEYNDRGWMKKVTVKDEKGHVTYTERYQPGGWRIMATRYLADSQTVITLYHQNGREGSTFRRRGNKMMDGAHKLFYENGDLEADVVYKDQKKSEVRYYHNGKISSETVADSASDKRIIKHYYESGQLKSVGEYNKENPDGIFKSYHENGKLSEESYSVDGRRNGNHVRYYDNGRVWYTRTFADGVCTNVKCYDSAGKLLLEREGDSTQCFPLFYPAGEKRADACYDELGYTSGAQTYYTRQGRIKEESEFKRSKRTGLARFYLTTGKLRRECNYEQGKLAGLDQQYDECGKLTAEGIWKDGKRQGLWKYYYKNGSLRDEIFYTDGECNGGSIHYLPNGKKDRMTYYNEGLIVAQHDFDTSGSPTEIAEFNSVDSPFTVYRNSGTLRYISSTGRMKYGKLEGEILCYHSNGVVGERFTTKDGRITGTHYFYYPDGSVHKNIEHKDGENDGKFIVYDIAGNKYIEESYVNGTLTGPLINYAAGQIMTTSYYNEDGKQDSVMLFYGEDGKVACILYIIDGEATGYSYIKADGKPIAPIPLIKGSGKIKTFYANGKPAAEMVLSDNKLEGEVRIYYSNGKLFSSTMYKEDILQGPMTVWYSDGKKRFETSYNNGELNGQVVMYDAAGRVVASAEMYDGIMHGVLSKKDKAGKMTKYTFHYNNLIKVE